MLCHAQANTTSWVHALSCPANSHNLGCMLCSAQAIQAHIAKLDKGLRRAPESLNNLKDVLGIVAAVRSGGMVRELQYTELEERFRSGLNAITTVTSVLHNRPMIDPLTSSTAPFCLCAVTELASMVHKLRYTEWRSVSDTTQARGIVTVTPLL